MLLQHYAYFSLNPVLRDFSDNGEEGVLNALWQKYENAIDKVPVLLSECPKFSCTDFCLDCISITCFFEVNQHHLCPSIKKSADMSQFWCINQCTSSYLSTILHKLTSLSEQLD